MDPLTIGIMAVVALGVDILNDRFPVLRNITHQRIMSASTEELITQIRERYPDPCSFARRSANFENSSGPQSSPYSSDTSV